MLQETHVHQRSFESAYLVPLGDQSSDSEVVVQRVYLGELVAREHEHRQIFKLLEATKLLYALVSQGEGSTFCSINSSLSTWDRASVHVDGWRLHGTHFSSIRHTLNSLSGTDLLTALCKNYSGLRWRTLKQGQKELAS